MPQIPTVAAPNLAPPPGMNPGAAGIPGAQMARLGQQTQELAGMTIDVDEKIRAAQEHLALLTAGNQITAEWNKYQETLAQSGDPDHMPNPDDWKNNLKAQFSENPKYADPRVQRALEAHIDAVGEDARHTTMMRQLTLQRQQEIGNLAELRQTVVYEMAGAQDQTMRGLARGRFEVAVADAVKHGWISPKEEQMELHNLDATAEDVEIVNAIDRENPASIQAMIDKTEQHPELFKDIEPKRFAELKKVLRTQYGIAKERKDRQDVSSTGDLVLSKVKNDIRFKDPHTGEFNALEAAKSVNDDPDVPTDVKKYVRTELEQEDGVQQKLKNDRDQKYLDDLDPAVESGQLTFREITKRQLLPNTDPNHIPRRVADKLLSRAAAIQRENRVESMQERSMLRQEAAEKSANIANELLFEPGYLTDRSELTPYRLKGLSTRDANAVWQAKRMNNDPTWKQNLQRIQESPLFDTSTDEGKSKMMHFVADFAKTVQDKKLTGSQITDELDRELKPQEQAQHKTIINTMLDNIWPMVKSGVSSYTGIGNPVFIPKTGKSDEPPARPAGVPKEAVWNGEAKQWQLPQAR